MLYLIGLGNKDKKYRFTRHNVGYLFLDYLKSQLKPSTDWQPQSKKQYLVAQSPRITLIKPQTYMNLSGKIVKKVYSFIPPQDRENMIIIHDDLDLPLGKWKLSFAKGPKGHNGVISIEESLQTQNFWRLRIGIDNRDNLPPSLSGAAYVLSPFTPNELETLQQKVFPTITEQLSKWSSSLSPAANAADRL